MEIYIFFGLALLGLGWLWGNYVKESERHEYTAFIINCLIENKYLRQHRIQITKGIFVAHVVPWNISEKELEAENKELLDFRIKDFTKKN